MREQDLGPRILIVETDREHALMMEARISRRFENPLIEITDSPEQAEAAIKLHSFDVAVIDFNHTMYDGLDLVRSLCRHCADLSVIVVADELTEQSVRELFRCGCDELLIKDSTFYNVVPHLIQGLYRRRVSEVVSAPTSSSERHTRRRGLSPELLNRLSNEIDHPLSAILAAAQDILRNSGEQPSDIKERLRSIEQSANRIKTFVRAFSPESTEMARGQISRRDDSGKKV